ncbi:MULTISPECIES: DUF3558 domain-containing protein [unclassified Streptomyces]|uniref:DUF3558 domain-containing protein n=1 Tax=unclassified Streptomyces TaxID=2593676 RepID=UPI002DD82C13|nr:DUF3558 domain-containing protein [Streptomyces sp. NBC_00243]WRZ20705.1 DUF3558 domain-containing protein [Streptomyces sp. NBC_00243]
MQRKAYVPGVAVLLAALLAGCTGGSSDDGATDDSKPGGSSSTAPAAQPGKYRTLPEACAAVDHGTLDSLLPGIKQISDEDQRETAYEGTPTLTYDTDRRVGCRWKVESTDATDHLFVDFERVVSYDSVSDDGKASGLYTDKETAADLPEPSPSASSESEEGEEIPDADSSASPSDSASGSASSTPSPTSSASDSASPSVSATPTSLQPRTLDGLGDEAYLNDTLSSAGSTAQQRTVTVVFRTSNVIVTIEYDEQPAVTGEVPDSKEMQDRARNLAAKLADTLDG